MLVKVTATLWNKPPDDMRVATTGTVLVLNGNRIQGLETRATTKSKFLYTQNTANFREKPAYIEADEAVATLVADAAKTWNSPFVALNFYTDDDASLATFARSIRAEDIIWVRKDATYPGTKSWVKYQEGGKTKEHLCSYSQMQVRELSDTGDLTTP